VKSSKPQTDDPLLWRLRRTIAQARSLGAIASNHRQAMVLTAELRTQIQALTERLKHVEDQMRTATRGVIAVSAYNRCATLGYRAITSRNEGTGS
jgi:hypothetical protein